MRIAVMSDSHDNIWNLDAALKLMRDADVLIHCGDLCSPFVVKQLGKAAGGRPVHIVWGNNDGDILLICQVAAAFDHIHLHGAFAELRLDGSAIAVNHYPEIARGLAESGRYDFVFYGHDHTSGCVEVNRTKLVNPGELMGMNGQATIALVETATSSVDFVEVRP